MEDREDKRFADHVADKRQSKDSNLDFLSPSQYFIYYILLP